MTRSQRLAAGLLLLMVFWHGAAIRAEAQTPCQAPAPPVPREPNIFSEAQEQDLSDAVAEYVERQFRLIDDEALVAPLRAIGTRLLKLLPPSDLKFTFHLVEAPDANAFVMAGGRIYVTRKMVAFARTEDELAGVIGHEIGHLMARHYTASMTQTFKNILGVTAVTDRRDVFEKFNRLVDAPARAFRSAPRRTSIDEAQSDADRLGIFLVAAAGYDAEASVTLFERLVELKGETGGFFSDLFGRTSPDVKRLRALVKTQAGMAKSCMATVEARQPDAFVRWQTAVVSYTGRGRTESLDGVVSRRTLSPGLQGDLTSLRFSPDGQFVLAQDTATVTVLAREPFHVAFSFDAPGALRPRFTPDSQQVAFHTADLRVQVWNIAEKRLRSVHEVVVPASCRLTDLSPDGRVLACLDSGFDLVLYDVATSAKLLERKAFFKQRLVSFFGFDVQRVGANTGLTMAFSPDGRYFAAGFHEEGLVQQKISDLNEVLLYDLKANAPVSLSGGAKRLIAGGFSFAGNDRLLVRNVENIKQSAIIALPSGEVLQTLALIPGRFDAVTAGGYATVRPFEKYAVAVLDLDKGRIIKAGAYPAVDVYRDTFVAERTTGELALYAVEGNRVLATTMLPRDDLEPLRGAVVSPDLRWLAVSGAARGALWDLSTGRGIAALPAFAGGTVAGDGQFYVDVQPLAGLTRQVGRVEPASGRVSSVGNVPDAPVIVQVGSGLMSLHIDRQPNRPNRVVLEMRDATTFASLWTTAFSGGTPRVVADTRHQHVFFLWPTVPQDVRNRLKTSEAVLKKLSSVESGDGYLLEVWDAKTGESRGRIVIEAPPSTFASATVVGDNLIVSNTVNRVRVYSLASGDQRGGTFGRTVAVSRKLDLIAVENGAGRLIVYDFPSLSLRGQFTFRRPIALAEFNEASTQLLAVTGDQAAVTLTVPPAR